MNSAVTNSTMYAPGVGLGIGLGLGEFSGH